MYLRAPRPKGPALAAVCASAFVAVFVACGGEVSETSGGSLAAEDAGSSPDASGSTATDANASDDANDASATTIAPAGLADGVCVAGDVRLGLYDPDCVYLLGTTMPASQGYDVLVDPANPQRSVKGFGNGPSRLVIRPSDQRLLFVAPTSQSASSPRVAKSYRPNGAHELIDATCEGDQPWNLFPDVDTPAVLYECIQGGTKYFAVGDPQPVDTGGKYIVTHGENGALLVRVLGGGLYIRDAAGERPVLGEWDTFGIARSKYGGGFWAMGVTVDDVHFPNLYQITTTGGVSVLGKYHMGVYSLTAVVALEGDGALVGAVTLQQQPYIEGVVRFRVGVPPEVLLDESKAPVQIHGGTLVTGP